MGLENPTFISTLVPTNPGAGDLRSEGDDHIRRLKQCLQNTFPDASRAFYFPRGSTPVGLTINLAKTDDNSVVRVDTSGGLVTLNLPADAFDGWHITVIKVSNDTNPILVTPPVGTLFSGGLNLSATRRAIPRTPFGIYFDGTNFSVERCVSVPVNTILDFDGGSLPVGYEWPNGQTLASAAANYPDFFAVKGSGVTRDVRGRVLAARDVLGGAAAGILTSATMTPDGQTLGATGGTEQGTLNVGQLPTHTPTTNTITFGGTTQSFTPAGTIQGDGFTLTPTISGNSGNVTYTDPHHTHTLGNIAQFVSSAGGGGGITVYVPGAGVTPTLTSDATGIVIPSNNIASTLSSALAVNTIAGHLSFAGTAMTAPLGANATLTVTLNPIGSGNPFSLLQPTMAMNKILVVE